MHEDSQRLSWVLDRTGTARTHAFGFPTEVTPPKMFCNYHPDTSLLIISSPKNQSYLCFHKPLPLPHTSRTSGAGVSVCCLHICVSRPQSTACIERDSQVISGHQQLNSVYSQPPPSLTPSLKNMHLSHLTEDTTHPMSFYEEHTGTPVCWHRLSWAPVTS